MNRTAIAHLAHALRPFLSSADRGPTSCALEVARNVAFALADGVEDPYTTIEEMLVHRHRHGWVMVSDVAAAAWVGTLAWTRATAEKRAA